MGNVVNVELKEIELKVDLNLFSKDGLFKCLYWYSNLYVMRLKMLEHNVCQVTFSKLDGLVFNGDECNVITAKFSRDLIDFNLRDIVSKETRNVRELLIAKAFSNGEFDELPIGDSSDPVGFDIESLK